MRSFMCFFRARSLPPADDAAVLRGPDWETPQSSKDRRKQCDLDGDGPAPNVAGFLEEFRRRANADWLMPSPSRIALASANSTTLWRQLFWAPVACATTSSMLAINCLSKSV